MSIARFHAEWLNLLEINGPFLTLPVLTERLRSGLEPTDASLVAELRTARTEVEDDPTLHFIWTRWVITDLLGFPAEVLREGAGIGPTYSHRVAEHGETLRPDVVVIDQSDDGTERARLLINIWPAGTDLTERPEGERWAASPIDRIAELCRATTVRLGLVTNGNEWTLVDAPPDGTTGTATWDATLWLEERATLDAFTTLVGVRRFFTVADNETLEALLMQSANAEAEVTDQLGKQVRAAVELLVEAMSRADRDRGGSVFRDLAHAELDQDLEPYIYEAAVTVLMRLVFLLSAEERGLFLLGDPTYDATYAVSTLLAQLDEDSNRYGEDVLERRTDAWHRLLATFRIVHAGAAHANLRLPPYGGSLFDPDRFPFIEGRRPDQPVDENATPLRIDNRTIKHILDALQVLRFRGKGGWQEARRLSFRTLGVEQIGHVYEGLLDHGVVQVTADAVALTGKNDPEVALTLIEEAAAKGQDALVTWLAELTGDKPKSVEKALAAVPEPDHLDRLASACDNDPDLAGRVAPYLGLLRTDLRGLPQVYLPDSYYVTKSSDRRSSGAYYTPRALAEEMVAHTLEPLVYNPGPAEGAEPDQWKLKPTLELLDLRICDMAMGSGAFLVSACRYLSERLLEAWAAEALVPGELIPLPGGATTPMPDEETDREVLARRLVADRCLYGVDRNPMAVEMAKLSLWLITLAKDRPFTFVDHALRCGDSLLGITDLRQLDSFHLDPARGRRLYGGTLFDPAARIEPLVKVALEKRRQLESFTVIDIHDVERKRRLLDESRALLDQLGVIANLVIGAAISTATQKPQAYDTRLLGVSDDVIGALDETRAADDRRVRLQDLDQRAAYWLDEGRPALSPARQCLHWVLEFPEVFLDRPQHGFDAVVGNPPFLGVTKIEAALGASYREALHRHLQGGVAARADLVVLFLLRSSQIVGRDRTIGLVATQTISQAGTRRVGLDRLLDDGYSLYRASKGRPWPGEATLSVALIWLFRGTFRAPSVLDGERVDAIDGGLEVAPAISWRQQRLANQALVASQGVMPLGAGFVVAPQDAEMLVARDPRSLEVLKPFLTGEDLNSHPEHSPSRFIIDFGSMDLEEAALYGELFEIVETKVKPVRDKNKHTERREKWWMFGGRAESIRSKIAGLEAVIVIAQVSKTAMPVRVSNDSVYSNKVIIFNSGSFEDLAILSSSIHYWWAIHTCGTMREDLSYSPHDCLETLPVVTSTTLLPQLAEYGRRLQGYRSDLMKDRWIGLTSLYNFYHRSAEMSEDISGLRMVHCDVDNAVLDAYGWDDIDLDHGFHETRQGQRYTIGPEARRKLLERLLLLNREQFTAEDAQETRTGTRNGVKDSQSRSKSHPDSSRSLF